MFLTFTAMSFCMCHLRIISQMFLKIKKMNPKLRNRDFAANCVLFHKLRHIKSRIDYFKKSTWKRSSITRNLKASVGWRSDLRACSSKQMTFHNNHRNAGGIISLQIVLCASLIHFTNEKDTNVQQATGNKQEIINHYNILKSLLISTLHRGDSNVLITAVCCWQ